MKTILEEIPKRQLMKLFEACNKERLICSEITRAGKGEVYRIRFMYGRIPNLDKIAYYNNLQDYYDYKKDPEYLHITIYVDFTSKLAKYSINNNTYALVTGDSITDVRCNSVELTRGDLDIIEHFIEDQKELRRSLFNELLNTILE